MRILVTGFEAFDGSTINPSERVIRSLASHHPENSELNTVVLPVDTNQAPLALRAALEAVQPQVVLCLGEASGRSCISIERIAINLLDFRIPDNAGVQVIDMPAVPGAPSAYFSSLPVRLLVQTLSSHGIPVELSLSAGSYLCNQIFFELMHWLAIRNLSIPAGFIHLPSLPEQIALKNSKAPSMSFETIENACRLIINVMTEPR